MPGLDLRGVWAVRPARKTRPFTDAAKELTRAARPIGGARGHARLRRGIEPVMCRSVCPLALPPRVHDRHEGFEDARIDKGQLRRSPVLDLQRLQRVLEVRPHAAIAA